jgi:hypothetical protein
VRNEGASVLEVMQAEDLESLFLLPFLSKLLRSLRIYRHNSKICHMMWMLLIDGPPSGVTITLQGNSILNYSRTWRFILFLKSFGNLDVPHVSSSSPG